MSGYLHRIASSVLKPATGIHPSVGSLWTGAGEIEPAETILLDSAAPLQPSHEAGTSTNAGNLFPSPTLQYKATPFSEAHASGPTQASATPMVDLTTTRTPRATVQPLVAPERSDAVSFGDASRETRQPRDLNRTAERGPTDHTTTPFVEPSARPSQLFRPLATTAITHPMPVHQHERASTTREPDEIQIHIGRIEVTAALPLPPPRPATSPERKSIDLGEYLKRDGRQR